MRNPDDIETIRLLTAEVDRLRGEAQQLLGEVHQAVLDRAWDAAHGRATRKQPPVAYRTPDGYYRPEDVVVVFVGPEAGR